MFTSVGDAEFAELRRYFDEDEMMEIVAVLALLGFHFSTAGTTRWLLRWKQGHGTLRNVTWPPPDGSSASTRTRC